MMLKQLLGEVWQGAAKCLGDVIMMTLGTGVGGAVMSDGKLLKGVIGRAGHLGHMSINYDGHPDICSTPGSIEDAIGMRLSLKEVRAIRDNSRLIETYASGNKYAESLDEISSCIGRNVGFID